MKDSHVPIIGQIPSHWQVRKVRHLYSLQTGFTPDTKREEYYDDENGHDWLTIGDLKGRNLPLNTKGHISDKYLSEYPQPITPKGSLLYSFKLSVGQVAIADRDVYTNEAIASFLPNHKVNLNFLYYSSSLIIGNANENIYGAKLLNQDLIYGAKIVFPPLPEQCRIADFLDRKCADIDNILEKTKASIEEYRKLKQAIITEAVTKGIRGDRPMKDSGIEWIGEIPEEWTVSRVGLHYTIILGKMLCSEPKGDDYSLEKYYCAADVHFAGICKNNIKTMWFSENEKRQYKVLKGDLLIVEGGAGAGGCAIVNDVSEDLYIQNSIMIVRPLNECSSVYLRFYIESIIKRGYIDVACNKATIPHFTKDKLSTVPTPLPAPKEQAEIALYLDRKCSEIDSLIKSKEMFIKELEAYRKSLIYEYVTGKREVNE